MMQERFLIRSEVGESKSLIMKSCKLLGFTPRKEQQMAGDAVVELIEKYRPQPDALFEYDGDNHGDTAEAASNITAREIIRQLESILPQRDIEASNSAKREVWAYVQKFLGKEGSDGSTFEDWVRERDAATRIAALEEAAEHLTRRAKAYRESVRRAAQSDNERAEALYGELATVCETSAEHILALRTQSDLDWLERHDAQVTLKEAEAWFLRAHGLRWEDYCAPASEVSYTYTETFLADYERVAELRKLAGK